MYGIPVQDAVGDDDYALSIESSFEQKRGARLMKPPLKSRMIAEDQPKKPTKRDLARQAKETERQTEKVLAEIPQLPPGMFEVDINPAAVDVPRIPEDVAKFLVDRFIDSDLHELAISEAENPLITAIP